MYVEDEFGFKGTMFDVLNVKEEADCDVHQRRISPQRYDF